jgi:hypothetical protein
VRLGIIQSLPYGAYGIPATTNFINLINIAFFNCFKVSAFNKSIPE